MAFVGVVVEWFTVCVCCGPWEVQMAGGRKPVMQILYLWDEVARTLWLLRTLASLVYLCMSIYLS